MKKIFLLITALLILTSLTSMISAEIIVKQQPKEIYNLGDSVTIPVTIKTISGLSKVLKMDLICDGYSKQFYENGINLNPGEEITINDANLILTKEKIGATLGFCKIKISLGEDYVITNDFEISNLINIQSTVEIIEFNPEESMLIKGNAQKANGEDANGLLNIHILSGENVSEDINQLDTISNGFFSANITFPKDMKAGTYLVKIDAYELEEDGSETKTNKGFMNYNILIKQVPTSLEIAFEEQEVEPGANLKARAIMRDQTGEKIEGGTAIITIKKKNNEIVEQKEVPIEEYLEYPIIYNEPPGEWKVVAVSRKITSEGNFIIKEKRKIDVVMINETINLVNTGNIPYSGLVFVKIGEETLELNVSLEVDEIQKYKLSAPEGEYVVEVVSDGEQKLEQSVTLTGRAIDIKELKNANSKSMMKRPLSWIFIIMILGLVVFMIWKKGLKKSFFGRIRFKKKPKKTNKSWEDRETLVRKPKSIIDAKNKAVLSLAMKGKKHPSSVVCLKIKNLSEIQETKNNVKETLNKIVSYAESQKAIVYENQENIFFILSPTKTRTFKNERKVLDIAELTIKEINSHNKLFNQKIEFGISLNYGNIVSKEAEDKTTQFMSLGNLIAFSKKLSTVSNGKILISEEMKQRLKEEAKFQEHKHPGMTFYTIKEMKNTTDHSKFLSSFMKRMEEDQKKQQEKKE